MRLFEWGIASYGAGRTSAVGIWATKQECAYTRTHFDNCERTYAWVSITHKSASTQSAHVHSRGLIACRFTTHVYTHAIVDI